MPHYMILLEGTTAAAVDTEQIISTMNGALGAFSPENLLVFIAAGIAAAGGLVLTWFGVNFLTRKVMKALKKGRL